MADELGFPRGDVDEAVEPVRDFVRRIAAA
jgi:hypothetical protein